MNTRSESKSRASKIYKSINGFTLCQQNGQRTYGGPPPGWGSRPPPSRDCEVFIGRLPRMCFEDELIPLFASVGELYEFRLMLDFSGTNRGYGYAHYTTPEGAAKAIKYLNKFEIRPKHFIGVLKSINNCRLLFGNIKSALNVNNFAEFIRSATDQVLKVFMFTNFKELNSKGYSISSEVEEAFLGRVPKYVGNNQFAIVEYENHKAAAIARRVLIPKYGHILAIDWAVPPRDKKRFPCGSDVMVATSEHFNSQLIIDSPVKLTSKIRPVPELKIEPSVMDNVPFMHESFVTVVKYFKYQLSVSLYISVNQLEIPLYICKEIEKKIVDRITNLENCGQAVQLIFNYFSWYNEKKSYTVTPEVEVLLHEVKQYANAFLHYVTKRLQLGSAENSLEDEYYTYKLPLQLNILFHIILQSSQEFQAKLSGGITKGLHWLSGIMQSKDEEAKIFLGEIIAVIENENPASLDKAINSAKSNLLNIITSYPPNQRFINGYNAYLSLILKPNHPNDYAKKNLENLNVSDKDQEIHQKMNLSNVKTDNSIMGVLEAQEEPKSDFTRIDSYPPVPLLLNTHSITNASIFVSGLFCNVIAFFKHTLRVCINTYALELNIPQEIKSEIHKKIIERISNIEKCCEGVNLIQNYLLWWTREKPAQINTEIEILVQEVKMYSSSFFQYIWKKTFNSAPENNQIDNFYENILPLKLALLYQIIILFNGGHSFRYFIRISNGLMWIDRLLQNNNKISLDFVSELSRYIGERNSGSFEKAKNLAKEILKDSIDPTLIFEVHDKV